MSCLAFSQAAPAAANVAFAILRIPGEILHPSYGIGRYRKNAPSTGCAHRSPQEPLMNCTTAQGMPWPMQRRIIPNPELDLPLPGPVWMMISPFFAGLGGHHPVACGLDPGHLAPMALVFRRDPDRSSRTPSCKRRRPACHRAAPRFPWFNQPARSRLRSCRQPASGLSPCGAACSFCFCASATRWR